MKTESFPFQETIDETGRFLTDVLGRMNIGFMLIATAATADGYEISVVGNVTPEDSKSLLDDVTQRMLDDYKVQR